MERLYYSTVKTSTPVGDVLLAASDRGLAILSFRDERLPRWQDAAWKESKEEIRPYADQLREYLAGDRKDFDLPLDLRGPDFHQRCWKALLGIGYGKTKTYGEIAKEIGSPAAFRAVG